MKEDAFSVDELEARIRAAGNCLRPSDDLRPQIIEAAKEQLIQRRNRWRLAQYLAALVLIGCFAVPLMSRIDQWINYFRSPTSIELHQQAVRYADDRHVGEVWGLTEAYTQLRAMQAERLLPQDSLLIYGRAAK